MKKDCRAIFISAALMQSLVMFDCMENIAPDVIEYFVSQKTTHITKKQKETKNPRARGLSSSGVNSQTVLINNGEQNVSK